MPLNDLTTPTSAVLTWFDRRRGWLWLVIAVLYAVGFNGQWRIGPDSAIHVSIAKSLAQGDGFTHPTGLEDTVNPGLAHLTAGVFKLFGVDHFIAINVVMLLCSAGVLVLAYWVVRLRFGRATAVVIVCMLAVNETFYRYGYQVLTDMPFLLGLMGMLLGNELLHRRGARVWWGVGVIALAVLFMAAFRSVVLTVLAAGAMMVVYRVIRGQRWMRYTGVAAVVIGVLVALRLIAGGMSVLRDESRVIGLVTDSSFTDTLHRVFMENGPTLLNEHLPEAMFGVDFGAIVGLPLGLIAVVIGLGLFRFRPIWGLLVAAFLAQWLLLITTERYVLVLMPLLALGWWRIGQWAQCRISPTVGRWVVAGLLVIWFGPNLIRVGAFIAEQRSRPFLVHYDEGRYAGLKLVAEELSMVAGEKDTIIADDSPQLTYFTGLPVFGPDKLPAFGPARELTLKRLRSAGKVVLVSPVGEKLSERITSLRLWEERVLKEVPTPVYGRRPDHKLVLMGIRKANWENYRLRKEKLLQRSRDAEQRQGEAGEPPGEIDWENYRRRKEKLLQRARAAEQRQGEADQQPGEGEQPDDQPR